MIRYHSEAWWPIGQSSQPVTWSPVRFCPRQSLCT